MLDLSTSLALLPYLLAAAYALKLGLTGEACEFAMPRTRRKETVIAAVATAYTIFQVDAAGLKFVLLMTVILVPAALLYISRPAASMDDGCSRRPEIGVFALILVGAVVGAVRLWTGRIPL